MTRWIRNSCFELGRSAPRTPLRTPIGGFGRRPGTRRVRRTRGSRPVRPVQAPAPLGMAVEPGIGDLRRDLAADQAFDRVEGKHVLLVGERDRVALRSRAR